MPDVAAFDLVLGIVWKCGGTPLDPLKSPPPAGRMRTGSQYEIDLGAHVGAEMARVDDSGGQFAMPPATPISRHAVLAGINAAAWEPLIAEPRDEMPRQVLQRYRGAFDALAAEVARMEAPASAPR